MKSLFRTGGGVLVLLAAAALTACGGSGSSGGSIPHGTPVPTPTPTATSSVPNGKIQHIVFIVQENRSFDNLFQGYPGANTVSSGKNSLGQTIKLVPVSLATQYVIDHSSAAFFAACDGSGSFPGTNCKNDGFDKESSYNAPHTLLHPEYVYVPHNESQPYFDMAHEGVLADDMFTSQLDESFVAHQYIIGAQASSAVNLPFGDWGCEGGPGDQVQEITRQRTLGGYEVPCFDHQTLADELDAKHYSWRFYTSQVANDGGEWSGYQAISHIYNGPDWKNDVITPQTSFLSDVASGQLATMTWITPICFNSDHVNCGGGFGPDWVASLVNAVGTSKFWKSTAIFIMWDDWGGLYDHVPPPFKDYDGLGFRVGLVMLSPYAKPNYVSHVQYETASVLRFVEDTYGLGQLSAADRRATSPAADSFNFAQTPRAFVPIATSHSPLFFMQQYDDGRPPDDD